jgi:NADPH:quinone reductase-like Zn-dependent oxidoreductase
MKAIVYDEYGSPDVLRFEEIEKPTAGDDEVLIKVRAASINPLDFHYMRGTPHFMRIQAGLRRPKDKRIGVDMAGQVEGVGRNVTQFKPGDEVFGVCRGAFAEYACAKEDKVVLKPANKTFEEAAAVPVAGLTALQGLRDKGRIQRGQKILVDGASGGVGTFAMQVAKSYGAEVTAVCSTGKVDTARAIGAVRVIDYTREDFTKSGQRYDLIFAANAHHSIFDYRSALSEAGIFVMVAGGWAQVFQTLLLGPVVSRIGSKKICFVGAKVKKQDLEDLKELLESGRIVPVIERCYPLSEAAEAVRYLEKGHARGKVVLSVG